MKLRNKISPNLEYLDELFKQYKWIPNSDTIRPSPENLELKRSKCKEIEEKWSSFTDFILHEVYGKERMICNGKYTVIDHNIQDMKVFCRNFFPYNLQIGNYHIFQFIV
jgi:hypothetical protein